MYEARKVLTFVSENNQIDAGAYKKIIDDEIQTLQNLDDNYLLHDHLEAINDPCYFHEFMSATNEKNLQYIAEIDLPTMFLGNQKKEAERLLGEITDPVRQEQYLDFITKRRFRMTLLTHGEDAINKSITPISVQDSFFGPRYSIEHEIDLDKIGELSELKLVSTLNAETKVTITGSIAAVRYVVLSIAAPLVLSLDDIINRVYQYLPGSGKDKIRSELDNVILHLLFTGIVWVSSTEASCIGHLSEKPKVFNVALLKSKTEINVPNMRHETIRLRDDQRVIMQYVSGEYTIKQLNEIIRRHIENGELIVSISEIELKPGDANFEGNVENYVAQQLNFFCQNALLIT